MARPSRTALYADDRTFLWKAILRFLAILLALVGIATTAWALVNQFHTPDSLNSNSNSNNYYNNNYENYYDPYYDFASLPWTFITLGLSVIWNTANLGVLFSRNKPIHPGANVGCDLILWLGLIVTGTAAVIGATGYFYYIPEEYDNGYNSGDSYGTFTNSSGTWYQLPDGTLANQTTAHDCGGFSSCSAAQQYAQSIQRKGIIIAVGAAMSFVVLYVRYPSPNQPQLLTLSKSDSHTSPSSFPPAAIRMLGATPPGPNMPRPLRRRRRRLPNR